MHTNKWCLFVKYSIFTLINGVLYTLTHTFAHKFGMAALVSKHLFNLPLNARAINAINVYNKTIFVRNDDDDNVDDYVERI